MKEIDSIIKYLQRFLKHQKGSVSIEFVLMITVLFFILFFMIDLTVLRSNLGKLDNASYSLVNILRERTQLYDAQNNTLNQELDNFRKLAKRIIYENSDSQKELFVVLESLSFPSSTSLSKDPEPTYEYYGDEAKCKPYQKLDSLKEIAPRSESKSGRKLPLYQVTLCIPSYSLFKAITSSDSSNNGRTLRSSSVTVGR